MHDDVLYIIFNKYETVLLLFTRMTLVKLLHLLKNKIPACPEVKLPLRSLADMIKPFVHWKN